MVNYPWAIERDYLSYLLELLDEYFTDLFKELAKKGFSIKLDEIQKADSQSMIVSCTDIAEILGDFDLSEYLDNLMKLNKANKERYDDKNLFAYSLFERLRQKYSKMTEVFEKKLKTIASQTSDYNYKIWQKQVKKAMSVDIFKEEKWLETEIQAFTKENVRLIKNIGNLATDQIQTVVTDAVKNGNSAKSITKDIQKIIGATQQRASLIAVDQIGKFNGILTKIRQTKLGVIEYIWTTVGDERVRLRHRELNGKKFAWDNPSSEGHPGQPIRCRCQALPVFDSMVNVEVA